VAFQVNTEEPPAATIVGLAVSAIWGDTFTVTLAVALGPPEPLHVNVYTALAVSAPVLCVPLVALVPLHAPDAVHEVALDAVQASSALAPLATTTGLAVMVTTGSTCIVTLARAFVPSAPAQDRE
jgi:hypothetical protein